MRIKNLPCLVFFFFALISFEINARDINLERLDKTISNREHYLKLKEEKLDSLRHLLKDNNNKERQLQIYEMLFREFLAFSFDSAMTYVKRSEALVEPYDSYDTKKKIEIHKALSLATSGHFSHAVKILKSIDSKLLSKDLKEEFFSACEWTYGVWAAYSDKNTIAPELTEESVIYLDSLIEVTPASSPQFYYRLAEKALRSHNYPEAEKYYLQALNKTPITERLYAQAAYALAMTYNEMGNKDKYKKWLINAAISDQTIPLKENLALQELALFLNKEEGDVEKANTYLKIALEDAIFYNNRLRMLEIAEKTPNISNLYQNTIERQNRRLKIYILTIGILLLILVSFCIYIFRQRQAVARSKDALAEMNRHSQLLNAQLRETNKSREQYVSLFMDLCAAYIEKLNRFPMVLKIKVKQLSDLKSVADRYVRPSEIDTREMFHNFDTAFLRLYPDYIEQFNSLLRPDKPILPKKGDLLSTDLRIYALVRMGISESHKIATLLFLSPQTIFNHRTQVRNRAIDRNNFEKDVMHICEVNETNKK
ncbi:MAG: hypothetical protein K2K81_08910 [Muribaculaceae bacterium]|nr:hypothetical protein [Muribaculaceae bacterium]